MSWNSKSMTFSEIEAALPSQAVTSIELPFPRIGSGKVREIFDLGDALLLAASDRLSAFDVILPDGIPGKGILLTQMSLWWFEQTEGIIVNHLLPDQAAEFDAAGHRRTATCSCAAWSCASSSPCRSNASCAATWRAAAGFPTQKDGTVCGIPLPRGLRQADRLPEPIFTPDDKGAEGPATTSRSTMPRARRPSARSSTDKVKAVEPGALPIRARQGPRGRDDPRRHEIRVRHGSPQAPWC